MNMTHTSTTYTNITHTTTLSRKEQEDTRRITVLCHLADDLSPSCPGDGDEYWILEKDMIAAAFLVVYKTEVTVWEYCAFIHPDFRRKRYFSLLLEQVCRYSEALGEPEFCFVTDNKCPATMAVLWELEAKFWNGGYMMEHGVSAVGTAYESGTSISQTFLSDTKPGAEPDTEPDADTHTTPEGLLVCARIPRDNSPADGNGVTSPDTSSDTDDMPDVCISCRFSLNDTSVYLCSLETVPVLHRWGLAGRFLAQLIRHLERKGTRRICLQASGSNRPALRLYRKTGPRITEILSYYPY